MTGPAKTRDELISSFSSKLFSAMLHEVIMDAALQSHKEVLRGKSLCQACGTRCGSAHMQGGCINGTAPSTNAPSSILAPSFPPSPSTAVSGSGIPTAKDGNIYFECTNCQKKIASNRYAPHLSGCLGIGTGSRRGAARNATAKNKLGVELDRASPFIESDYGSPAHDAVNGKVKGKGKNKKINGKAIDTEVNGSHKRPNTPDHSPAKKAKKQKTSSGGSETAIHVGAPNNIPPAGKIVKLGASSTSPYAPGSPEGGSISHDSGQDSPSTSASHSRSSSVESPATSLALKPKSYSISSDTQHKKRAAPPSSSTSQIVATDAAVVKWNTERGDPDFIDVDGEEEEESSESS